TLLSCEIALSAFRKKQFNKIVIARPITGDDLGFLPGDMHQKMQPWIAPIIHNFNMLQGKVLTEKMIAEGEIEILTIKYAKGITYVDSVVIIDEFTDLNYLDFRTMLTRLGRDSKIIFCGSEEQIDLKMKKYSCIHEVERLEDSGIVGYSTITDNHRNEDIMKITIDTERKTLKVKKSCTIKEFINLVENYDMMDYTLLGEEDKFFNFKISKDE